MARPITFRKKHFSELVAHRLMPTDRQLLKKASEKYGLSESEIIRRLIRTYLKVKT